MRSTKNAMNLCQQGFGMAAKSLALGGEGSLCFVKWDLFCQSTIQRSHCKPTGGYLGLLLRQGRRGRTWITGPYEVSPMHIISNVTTVRSDYCYAQLAIQETTASLQLWQATEALGYLTYHRGQRVLVG